LIAIYARQSVEKENSISLDAQIAHCKNIITKGDVKEYVDSGYSGSNINRPAFEQLMEDIKNGSITAVYSYRLDRISRNILDFANLQEFFKKHNCGYVSATENLDTTSPMGRAMVNIVMVFAQLERETIAGRIKDAYFARGKIGAFLGGGCPFGYTTKKADLSGKTFTILHSDPVTAPIARWIFETYTARRTSLRAIALSLNERGIKTSTGKPFTGIGVGRILTNPVYVACVPEIYDYFFSKGYQISNPVEDFDGTTGCLLFGKEVGHANRSYNPVESQILVKGAHEPLIDANTFIDAQYQINKNKSLKRSGTGKRSWLTGLTKCAKCGYSATVMKVRSYHYFKCSANRHTGVCKNNKMHPQKKVESFVEMELLEAVRNLNVDKLCPEQACQPSVHVRQQLIKIDQEISKLVEALSMAEGSSASKHIIKRIEDLDNQKAELSISLNPPPPLNVQKMLDTAQKMLSEWDSADIQTRSEWASTFIEAVYLGQDSIEISWNI